MGTLVDKHILIVGGSSGIAARVAEDAAAAGAHVVVAGRDPSRISAGGVTTARVDLTDEASIAALAATLERVDHLVVAGAAHANGPVAGLDRDAVHRAFDVKVIGPVLLVKHLGAKLAAGGSVVLFSGVAASRPAPGLSMMAVTNAAVSTLVAALALELAPVRVNAVSPGIVDSGAWDARPDKDDFLAGVAGSLPAGRVGTTADVSAAVLALLTNGFITGTTVHVDGGGSLV
ncbi:SDR family oxidoreductase [Actinokineospora bangkokensis]|uniref:Short-chain dehydrogenase n=1 Tax=Actinokineospora bangkokensis TaxID=1193682 RepID=A0A1Q9LPT7_9PSEU|nr:SDR family oxidoreductase [Actinokineospora bangkokensis]OLR94004.1 short-chain dehydrogenase [Actinokineospora bangkokensis]